MVVALGQRKAWLLSCELLSRSRSSKDKQTSETPQSCLPIIIIRQTHPQKGGESLAIVSHGKVVWFGPEDFHDVFIKFSLLDLKEENTGCNITGVRPRYLLPKEATVKPNSPGAQSGTPEAVSVI